MILNTLQKTKLNKSHSWEDNKKQGDMCYKDKRDKISIKK